MNQLLSRLQFTALAGFAGITLVSCAFIPFLPDRTAVAPVLEGFGHSDIAISTSVTGARQYFNRGVLQAYAFNEVEAIRAFKAALAQDPDCAICAWGVAWQLGPNINASKRGDLSEALQYVGYALKRATNATPRERALIESLALRYAHGSAARETAVLTGEVCGKDGEDEETAHPLDVAYAERMRALVDTYPNDPDILSLYAEAEIIATPGDSWDASGKPAGHMGTLTERLERLLAVVPDHTGLNHYLVHAADALPVAQRAVGAADRLGRLAPLSPHLVHMPAHIYVQVGRYADAERVNREAVANDDSTDQTLKSQGFSVSKDWRAHNLHFQWFAALMQGRFDAAMEAARARAQRSAKSQSVYAEYARSLPVLTQLRFEHWQEVIDEPVASGTKGLAKALSDHAKGIAHARTGKVEAARVALAQLQATAATARKTYASRSSQDKTMRSLMDYAEQGLQAELAFAQQRFDDALAHQTKVIAAVAKLDANEPPMLAAGTLLSLGGLQARTGHWSEAEASFRKDLAAQPGSGWALRGLVLALEKQGNLVQAAAYRTELNRSWSQASPSLLTAM